MFNEKVFTGGFERESDGKIFERALFGKCTETLSEEKKEFLKEEDHYDLVRKNQPYENPRNPKFSEHTEKESFPQKLIKETVEKLLVATKRREEGDKNKVKIPHPFLDIHFYTAVDSGLDKWHGVDAFVEWYLPNGEIKERVTLDATLHNQKEKQKADVLFSFPEELKRDFHKDDFAEELIDNELCNKVISELASVLVKCLIKHTEEKETLFCSLKNLEIEKEVLQ